jgi:peptidyl-prolyl cis-trans isomerase D
MLESFRKASSSWPIKILFGILVLAFGGFWGIGGLGDLVMNRSATQPAIKVGDISIAAPQVADEFRRSVEQMQPMFGGKLSLDQARQIGLLDRTIEQLVSRSLLDQAARDLDIVVDDDTLRAAVAAIPAFQDDQTRSFDKDRYQAILQRSGITEPQFLAIEREGLARNILVQAIGGGIRAPAALVNPLFLYGEEKRIGDTIRFDAGTMKTPSMPDESVLKAFIEAHKAQFAEPEMRGLTAIIVTVADLANGAKPSEADIQQAYKTRQAEFVTPEKRAVSQVLFNDQASAQAFLDSVKAGKPFNTAAGDRLDDLGAVSRDDLPLPQLADAIFGAAGPGLIGPVQTSLGWHVLSVSKIMPEHTDALADVRDKVVADLTKDSATKQIYDVSNKIEDSIGSGASIEETANSLGLKTVKIAAIDHSGKGPDGKPVPGVPQSNAFLNAAFQTDKGATSEVTPIENDGGYFVVRVDSIAAAALKPYESIKDQAFSAWAQQQREDAAYQQAVAAAERVKKGESLAQIAGSAKIESTAPLTRDGADPKAALVAAELFRLKPGEAAPIRSEGGSAVVVLKSIVAADPKQDQASYDKVSRAIGQSLSQGLIDQYLVALQRKYPVTVNKTLIASQFAQQ